MKREIQQKIKKLREERGFTLKQLAEKAGCTQSYISQIETGLAVPSLSMVGRLAAALKVKVVDLFSDISNGDETNWYLPRADRKTITYPDEKVTSQMLVSKISTKKMEPLISFIEPGGRSDGAERMNHPVGTEEFVLVLKGEIDFGINGKVFHLCEGDTLGFDGILPHSWVNNGQETAEVLFVFTPPIW